MCKVQTIIATLFTALSIFATTLEEVQNQILQGVNAIDCNGAPGTLLCGGDNAFPLITASVSHSSLPVAAGALYDKGRVIALGHPDFLASSALQKSDTSTFIQNALHWLKGNNNEIAVYRNKEFAKTLRSLDTFEIREIKSMDELQPSTGVLIAYPDSIDPTQINLLASWLKSGGGLLATGIGWGWQQLNPKKSLITDNNFNQLLAPAGLFITADYAGRTGAQGYHVTKPLSPALNIKTAALMAQQPNHNRETIQQISTVLLAARSVIPADSTHPLAQEIATLSKLPSASKQPTAGNPLTAADIPARLATIEFQNKWLADPLTTCQPHPTADLYPGLPPPEAPRITRRINIDLTRPRWHSTGLYAAAGEHLTVTLPPGAESIGLKLRIGSTTCNNTRHDKWSRAPRVDVEIPLNEQRTTAASPFGGMLYIVVPNNAATSTTPLLKLQIANACQAPWFKLGRDTPDTWRKKIRSLPAPWAELESNKIILTIPASLIRDMADPTPVLNYWDKVADLDAKLTGLPPERSSPERFVADIQLCAGWMHAGYPIMIPISTANNIIDLERLQKSGDWGFFHELGHNHQNYDWTFNGTVEVTVNFFTLYNLEHICGIKPRQTRMRDDGGERISQKVRKWVAGGKSYKQWCSDPFLALETFVRIQQTYGWEIFETLFAEYRTLKKDERPKNDLEKRDQWVTRLSRLTGHNMATIFDAWNIPISETARKTCSHYPRPSDQSLLKDL